MSYHKVYWRSFLLFLLLTILSSCESEVDVEISNPVITSFSLRSLDGEAEHVCSIQGDTITAFFPESDNSFCIPTIEGDFDYVEYVGEKVVMGATVVDFNNVCQFDCVKGVGEKAKKHSYTAIVKTQNGIPRIDIVTAGGAKIESKEEYVNATITIGNDPKYGFYQGDLEIRGRGNCTWTDYPKKSYKLKLKEKISIHGMPENKDWILLADYTDRSLMRTACMAEISKIVGLPYTINYTFVDLFINNEYLGTYYLTDQVEKGKSRVDITDDGYLIEDDKYYKDEPLFFTSTTDHFYYTFKYPKKLTADEERYLWIQSYINDFETSLHLKEESNYLEFIDIDTFAKWFIIEELLGNYDSNVYYVLSDRDHKMQMYPVWDAEWSLGLAYLKDGAWQAPEIGSPVDVEIWSNRLYFSELFKKSGFINSLKSNWKEVAGKLSDIPQRLDEIASTISLSQKDNFDKWQTMGKFVRVEVVVHDTWEEELEYLKTFYNQRLSYLNTYINNL